MSFRRVSPGNSRRQHAQFPLAIEVGGVSRISRDIARVRARDTRRDFSDLDGALVGLSANGRVTSRNYRAGNRQFAAANLPAGHRNFVDRNNGNNGRPPAPQRAVNPPASRFFALSLTTRAAPRRAAAGLSRSRLSALPIQQLSKQNIPNRSDSAPFLVYLTRAEMVFTDGELINSLSTIYRAVYLNNLEISMESCGLNSTGWISRASTLCTKPPLEVKGQRC